ncbi:MAG: hypothetical protein IJU23_12105 [Proteobacteria bacterium]|nr:hypothetical protein [Pseudomonadota bacterium]
MRKISLALTLIGLATVFCACGDDGNKSYCDSGFTDGCENGKYVYCEFEGSSSNGKIVTKATVEFNNVEYVCNENNELVPKDYVCENGILLHDGKQVENNAICDDNETLSFCNGNDLVQGYQACINDKVVACVKGAAKATTCKEGLTCVDYERGDHLYASCVKTDDIKTGCDDGVTTYGSCDSDSKLTFCTRKNTSEGKTVTLDCPSRGQSCMLIEEKEFGYDCSETCMDGDKLYNEHGTCEGNTLVYCGRENAGDAIKVYEWVCGDNELTCGFDENQYSCK